MRKSVAYVGTRNIYQHLIPSLKSLFAHTNVDTVYLLTEDDYFPEELPSVCRIVNVSGQTFFTPESPNYFGTRFTWMCMMRSALARVLTEEDMVLSLDFDTIINKDISCLWDVQMGDKLFMAASEPTKCKGGRWFRSDCKTTKEKYFNLGVAMYNLSALRNEQIDIKAINMLQTEKCAFLEQTAFNTICENRFLEINPTFNSNSWTQIVSDPHITHFAAIKTEEWTQYEIVKKYMELPWGKYEQKSEA